MVQGVPFVDRVVTELGARHPGTLPMHPALEFDWARLSPYGEYYSAKLAVCEAIWQLIHNGLLTMGHSGQVQLQRWTPTLDTDIPPGYSGSTRHIELRGLDATFPTDVLAVPSLRTNAHRVLTDRDLYLSDINIAGLYPLIDESLREAVNCFRHELLLPCLAMLTKGTEGAWTELGVALADFGTRAGDSHGASLRKKLENPFTGLKERIEKVAEYYRRPICDVVVTKSAVARGSIDQAAIWSDEVRDSRNVLHFGKIPAVPITYERVAVLMMATVGHLRAMYEIKTAADASP